MEYLLKASTLLLIFYVCYQLFLKRETFFQANRWFLLSGLILAASIPFVIIPIYIEYTPIDSSQFIITTNDGSIPETIIEEPLNYLQLLSGIYLTGILFFFGKLIIELLSLRHVFKHSKIKDTDGITIMVTQECIAPFSFFNRIVYNPNQFNSEELEHVINHEKAHVKELHSVDTIVAQLSCLIFWFNPIVWLYKKALQQNLEFIADQKAQYISNCSKSYQTVLLKASVQNHQIAFTNNFYTSFIKKRIVMLHKSKSNKLNQLKVILVLPLLALFMSSFNTKDVYVEIPIVEPLVSTYVDQQQEDVEIVITKDTTDKELKALQDELKSNGITFTYNGLVRNDKGEITSISTAFKNTTHSSNYNINGDDGIKSFRFKSSEDAFSVGTIGSDKNKFIFKSKDGKTKAQSSGSQNVFVFESDEDEDVKKDGNVVLLKLRELNEVDSLKVKLRNNNTWISDDGTKTTINASENGKSQIFISESDHPLFVIDGKIVKKSLFEDIDSDHIHSINVLKGKTALEAYGEKGKNGVIIMTKKDPNKLLKQNSNSNSFFILSGENEEPLYILDGTIIDKKDLDKIKPNNIKSMDVIKDKKALKTYGKKGKNGVVLINSIDSKNTIKNNPVIIEIEEHDERPRRIITEVRAVTYDDEKNASSIEFIITKNSSDAFIEKQKKALKDKGIDAKINKVRRNNAGEITSIKISLDDNQGRKSSASWKEKEQAIPDIVMGKSGDKLIVRSIGR